MLERDEVRNVWEGGREYVSGCGEGRASLGISGDGSDQAWTIFP